MTWRRAFLLGALFGVGVTTAALWEAGDTIWNSADASPQLSIWAFVLLTPGQFVPMFIYDATGSDAKPLGIATIFLCQIFLWSVSSVMILAMCRAGGCCRVGGGRRDAKS